MGIQNIDFGSGAENDGEFIATAFAKIQANFEELFTTSILTDGLGEFDNRLVRTDGTDGNRVQGSGITIDDSDNVSGIGDLSVDNLTIAQGGALNWDFIQDGTGATYRSLTDRLKDSVSVLDFIPENLHAGIRAGTNTTALDSYIAAATTHCTTGSIKALHFPGGVYWFSSAFTLPNNAYWVGDGKNVTVLVIASATDNLLNVSGQDVTLRGLRFVATVARTAGAFIETSGAGGLRLSDFFMGGAFIGIRLNSTANMVVADGIIQSTVATTGVGIVVDSGVAVTLHGILTGGTHPACQLRVNNAGDVNVIDCRFLGGVHALEITPTTGQGVNFFRATNTDFDQATGDAAVISPTGTGFIQLADFIGCEVFGANGFNISAAAGSIGELNVTNTTTIGNATYGLVATAYGTGTIGRINLDHVKFADNAVGARFDGVDGVRIANSDIGEFSQWSGNTVGIELAGTTDNVLIEGNNLIGNGTAISNSASGTNILVRHNLPATVNGDDTVPDEAYGSGWNGSLEIPTKNAVYDKIELILGTTLPGTYQPLNSNLTSWASVTRASGFDTFVATPSSANLRALLTDETGTGIAYFVGGALGTPSSGTLSGCTGLPVSTGISGLGTGIATALAVNTGSAGAPVLFNGALGTPSSGALSSCTGLPVSTGISGLGTGVATFLATPSSANLRGALTDETGSGAAVFGTSPSLATSLLMDSGFVMNWNAGDVTLTHSANLLAFAGGDVSAPRIGIGTSPAVELQVYAASGGARFRIGEGATPQGFDFAYSGGDSYLFCVTSGGNMRFGTDNTERMMLSTGTVGLSLTSGLRGIKIGGTAVRGTTEGTNQLVLFDGTAPAGTLTNGVTLYSASGELRSMDAAGNSTLLSPHDHETNEWIYHSVDTRTGKGLRIDMERMLRWLNEKFGTDFVHEFVAR